MNFFLNTPLFGVLISLVTFELGIYLSRKTKVALFNPLLISIVLIISFLLIFNIPLETYQQGGGLISFFLGPATVILAVPLYKQLELLKQHFVPILIGITVGCIGALGSVWVLSKLFNVSEIIKISMLPRSVTTPIGIEISQQIGGIPGLTVAAIVVTGIFGAVVGPSICKLLGIKDEVAVGVAIGTSSHALGTTKAIELGETQGAMSSLSIGIAGLITVFLTPIFLVLLNV